MRIDGPDYRHRGLPPAPQPLSDQEVAARAAGVPGATLDDFDALCSHLATMHPSRYLSLIEGVTEVFLTGVHGIDDQNVALRLVSLTDRLYTPACRWWRPARSWMPSSARKCWPVVTERSTCGLHRGCWR